MGELSVYVEHAVWYDAETKSINVTVPGAGVLKNKTTAPWSYSVKVRQYAVYEWILRDSGVGRKTHLRRSRPYDEVPSRFVAFANQSGRSVGAEVRAAIRYWISANEA
jgi:hypothetical protein